MWQAGSIDADTYVWLEGKMPDFAQVKTLPELYGTLKAAGGKGGAINARKAMWYYKDEAGAKQGPHFIDSLRIMYDFKEIGDATPVFTPGMDDFKPLAEVKELKDALSSANPQAAEAEYADDEDSPGADNKTAGGKTKPTKGSKEELDVAAKRIQVRHADCGAWISDRIRAPLFIQACPYSSDFLYNILERLESRRSDAILSHVVDLTRPTPRHDTLPAGGRARLP